MRQTPIAETPLDYAGFAPRFVASLLDSLIALPLSLVIFLPTSYVICAAGLAANFIFQLFTEVYMVRRWGGSPGKLLSGIRILRVDGEPVGSREAILRALPDLLFGACGSIALLIAFPVAWGSGFTDLSLFQRMTRIEGVAPGWAHPMTSAQNIWTWAELIVLLTNEKKRALHDFLAGTVVVIVRKPAQGELSLKAPTAS